jgi:succinyl-CoA synthetase alpha subunit
MPTWNFVMASTYHDSVTLMRLSRDLEAVPGVRAVATMMGTVANRALLDEAGLLTAEGKAAKANDLIVAVTADSADVARAALATTEAALASERVAAVSGTSGARRPRTMASAVAALPDATLALVSVPGPYAGVEARKALEAGLDVMIFSDNVPLATEIELKRLAVERGRLVMGPDCGTAIVNGVPLGFANAVPRGRIGIAAASGTGLQEVACQVAAAGEGVSHAIGVGGRDLSDEVGGVMLARALAALVADEATSVVCAIGKPPGPAVARRLDELGASLGKPCVLHLTGVAAGDPIGGGRWHRAATLEDAARAAVALARGWTPEPLDFSVAVGELARVVTEATAGLRPEQRFVLGLYSGGTLAWEALALLHARIGEVPAELGGARPGHRVVDLGEDAFTVGRPHPMLDGRTRREWIEREARDPSLAVLLLDVVLGYGAHPDPAGELLPAISAARAGARSAGRGLAVIASVCGTDADPQNRGRQKARLEAAGVIVMPSNAQAARLAALVAERRMP